MPSSRRDDVPFERRMEEFRREKDEAFRYETWSPLPPQERAHFAGLQYFEPDERWRVRASITRLKDGGVFEMATSTGEPRAQLRYARLEFESPAGRAALFAYKDAEHAHRAGHGRDRSLFVPFRDATSGKETYGAGRYLDLEEPDGDEIVIDFNLSYNPYCAYSEAYSCPLPPAENWLKLAVSAGEKNFGAH